MVDRKDAFDHYDSILCVGPHHVKEIRKREEIAGLPKKHLVEAGYYRLERIIGKYEICSPQKHVADRKCVLIAPSWGKKNIIESCGEKLCDILLGHGYKVIVRPHPETVKRSPEILKTIEAKFGNNPDFTLERSVKTDDSILQADHLICDYSGIALEYAFGTLRPVLFIDVPLKINNESYNDLGLEPIELSIRPIAGLTISPNDMDTVVQVLEKLESLKQDFHENIKSLRDRSIFNLGSSSAAGAEYIVKTLLKDQTV
jgi:YidC/Oxa1 family membrane protein insertase